MWFSNSTIPSLFTSWDSSVKNYFASFTSTIWLLWNTVQAARCQSASVTSHNDQFFKKKVSLQTHGFFHILCYNPLLSLFFRCSNCSILGTSFLDFQFSNMSQVYLVHSWPSPGVIPFSKESWFFIMGTVVKDLNRALGEEQNFLVLVY